MNDSQIIIRIDKKTKEEVQKLAKSFGLTLSDMIRTTLKQVASTRMFVLHSGAEEPTDFKKAILIEAKKKRK